MASVGHTEAANVVFKKAAIVRLTSERLIFVIDIIASHRKYFYQSWYQYRFSSNN